REQFALVRRLLREATTARQRGRLDDARDAYHQVLAVEATNGRATAGLAYVHLERDELPQALLWAQRLVRTRPEYASHWVLLGDVLRRGGNDDAARRAYARGLSVQPSWTTARRRLDELGGPP
ncbi:MAG: tetratricopeptide repeat protein, partial [Myxococcota bacterium]|nr:tetratricopeptide repeat protein [Myxococcota bacterium]